MDLTLVLVIAVIVLALAFDFTNGFHDAANAIATSVATRALKVRTALIMAAAMNLIGALLGTGVAKTIAKDIIEMPGGTDITAVAHHSITITLGALVGAIIWNLITWWKGLPSSSSHALIGAICGSGLAAMTTVKWMSILDKVVIPMILSPVIGFALAYGIMKLILWFFQNFDYKRTMGNFRHAQTLSAAAMALGHGLQDAQKTMGIIVLALIAGNMHDPSMEIPFWVKLAAASAISLGTYSGGYRIMKTLGRGMSDLDPSQGFAAESVSAGVLYTTAFAFHAPISTTHTITCAIMGVGATRRKSAVKWGKVREIVGAWILTLPMAALFGAISYWVLGLFI